MNDAPRAAEVGIVGGGYAGMAAAVALAQRGIRVTVYEAARQLGGRARTVVRDEHTLDNGQHILIGAYRETLALMREVGVDDEALLRLPLALTVAPGFSLRAARLPAPWHLAAGLLRAKGLDRDARLACLRFVAWAHRARFRIERDTTTADLLAAHGQRDAAIRYLWEPLCVAALNTPLAQASAQVFLNVLRDALGASRSASDLLLPRVALGASFPEPAGAYVAARGGEVRLGTSIARILRESDGFALVGARETFHHRYLIVATHPAHVPRLLGAIAELAEDLAAFSRFTYRPIVTVYLQYAQTARLPAPMVGMSGATTQWLFDRGAIAGQAGLVAAVISARARDGRPHATLGRLVQDEIAACYPHLGAPQWCQVIEEKRATFACTPGLVRPRSCTSVPGLFLAGDYTEPDYPGTLEAAVRSGIACARHVSDALGVGIDQASSARR